jgi:hypothetical protein
MKPSISRTTKQRTCPFLRTAAAATLLLGFAFLCYDTYYRYHNLSIPSQQNQQHQASKVQQSSPSFDLARQESLGFFDDITNEEWKRMQEKARAMYPNTYDDPKRNTRLPAKWFQNNYEPDFVCRHERRIGKLGDGGKWVCDPHRIQAKKDCLIYSVGSNGDASFERAVQSDIGSHCEIHTFDFGDYNATVVEQAPGVVYHRWGLSDTTSDGVRKFKTMQETVELLGHTGRTIDIFKIDCEGCELTTHAGWFDNVDVTLRQILVEIHSDLKEPGSMRMPETDNLFKRLYKEGYVIFHKEPNIAYWRFGKCVEYAFLKLSPSFIGNFSSR